MQFLKNQEIDKLRWDECIHQSSHQLIYANTFYLDNMAPGWSALTDENYEWVLPLTNKRKFGISYLYQPAFLQQLGVFSKPAIVVPFEDISAYLQAHIKFWEVNWNYTTPQNVFSIKAQVTKGNNFILDLSTNYEAITANYHNKFRKNIKRSKKFIHHYKSHTDYNKSIQLYRDYYGKRMPHVKENDYKNFAKICRYCLDNNWMICREAVNEENEIMANALLLRYEKRLYNIMNTTTAAGRKNESNHFLLNAIIKEFSEQDLVFDFEGSDLPGVKSFYESFGAINQPYYKIKYNRLPWLVRLFKN